MKKFFQNSNNRKHLPLIRSQAPLIRSQALLIRSQALLILIFILAIGIRFLYFPENVYFGFDQARDAYESQDIYKNFNLKIIGPSTAAPGLFHGPLYWYLIGPLYLLGSGNPVFPAAFLLILNALGIFLVFWLGNTLFNRLIGLLAALLFAFSFEQTQYAMYFGNPAPAVITILLFYSGLALAIFKRDWRGIPLSLLGLGLSVQFEFFLLYLISIFVLLSIVFRKRIASILNIRRVIISFFIFLLPFLTFVFAELKFGFRTLKVLSGTLSSAGQNTGSLSYTFNLYLKRLALQVHDNLFSGVEIYILAALSAVTFMWILKRKKDFQKIGFLLIWFFSTSVLTIFGPPTLYYTNVGISPSIVLLASFLIYEFYKVAPKIALLTVLIIVISNFGLITQQNHKGIISDIYVQEGMLLEREKKAIDYIYREASGKPIVLSAVTMPLNVNTTWAYLFSWHGKEKYGYLPYWAGGTAEGYPGSLPRWTSQEEDYAAFTIIEPTRGIREGLVASYLKEQVQYGEVFKEEVFGSGVQAQITVQRRR